MQHTQALLTPRLSSFAARNLAVRQRFTCFHIIFMSSFFNSLFGKTGGSPASRGTDDAPSPLDAPNTPRQPPSQASPRQTPSTNSSLGANDPSFRTFLAITGTEEARACIRCKYGPPTCQGIAGCLFESNVFYAKRELRCFICQQPTLVGSHLITKLLRGPYQGNYVHQHCALTFYQTNPKPLTVEPERALKFHMPPAQAKDFITEFVAGKIPLGVFDMTAGAGKTNALIYIAHQARALGLRILVLVFGVKAKEELIVRGLRQTEVLNFHSYNFRAYKRWVIGTLQEDAVMLGAPGITTQYNVEPTVVYEKMRLVVSFYFRKEQYALSLIKCFRPFVSALADQARTHGFGMEDEPTYYDQNALLDLVRKYKLEEKLDLTWTSQLTQPDKLNVDRKVGSGAEQRLSYALVLVGQVLALSLMMAIQSVVDGETKIYNEVRKKWFVFPIVDHKDMNLVPNVKQIPYPEVDLLLVDEAQDLDPCELGTVKAIKSAGASVLAVMDTGQSCFMWTGIELTRIAEFFEKARKLELPINYRCAQLIVAEGQKFYNLMGRNLTIEASRDVLGKVVTASFPEEPIDLNVSTLMLARKVSHAVIMYSILLFKGYPVSMHGMPSTISTLEAIFSTLDGTLDQAHRRLTARLSFMTPSDKDDRYDMHIALEHAIKIFLDLDPTIDASQPHARGLFYKWLVTFFTDTEEGVGVVRCSTMHAAKGTQADHVYIINPGLSPLQDRIALGGWEEYEELCVAFVARTRAKDRLVYLPDLDNTTRETLLELFEEKHDMPETATDSQETETTDNGDADANPDGDADPALGAALETLCLTTLPPTVQELEKTVRELLLRIHPDHNFNSIDAKEKTQAVLNARSAIKKILLQRAA